MAKKSRKPRKSDAFLKNDISLVKHELRDRDVKKKGSLWERKKIALAISGGIGATEAIKISREIRRYGAEVHAFLSPEARRFITPLSIEWATLRKPVCGAGPRVEYLKKFDLVLVCPATLHTISKAALALTDTVVDLVIANALGLKTPIFMVPTMNFEMWKNPFLERHLHQLKEAGVCFFPEEADENRLKVPDSKKLVEWLIQEWKQKK